VQEREQDEKSVLENSLAKYAGGLMDFVALCVWLEKVAVASKTLV
jgi:hypothetical protein